MSSRRALLAGLLLFLSVADSSGLSSCDVWRAEVLRRQVDERGEVDNAPYDATALGNLKHKPFLRIESKTAIAVVGVGAVSGIDGDPIHPMTNSSDPSEVHWIDTIWIENQLGEIICMRRLAPTEPVPARMDCLLPEGTMQITAYQHCNSHGTFKGQMLLVDAVQTTPGLKAECSLASCSSWGADASTCASSIAEYWRIYEREFSQQAATDGNNNLKHKPSLTLHGNGSATVVVGGENAVGDSITLHPMTASDDPAVVHWINAIWVVDQDDQVIASREFLPSNSQTASFTFPIPAGTSKIRAYEYCNKHGLFSGDEAVVSGGQIAASTDTSCNFWHCPNSDTPFATATDCMALKAEAQRRQAAENARSPLAFPLPYSTVDGNEKHSPYIVLDGTDAWAVVGKGAATGVASDPIHPMVGDPTEIHYIEAMWVEDQAGQIIAFRQLSPSEPSPATLYFDIPEGTTSVQAYEYCNKHGLFQGEALPVSSANVKAGARAGCSVQQCLESAEVSACQAFTAELFRRESTGAAKDDPSGKHKPYLMLDGTKATIVVGIGATPGNAGGLIHPMTDSNDADVVHWISHVYALDEADNLVAMCELLPTDLPPASCTFTVPSGVTSLRPYEFCNKHGLYVGDAVQILTGNTSANRQCLKRECTERHSTLALGPAGPVTPSSCDSWRAEVLRRQVDERGESDNAAYDATALGNLKHKPFLRVEGKTAIALVGVGAVSGLADDPIHPMTNSSDPSVVHWIDTIWIEDQLGDIICMRRLAPTEPAPARLDCPLPEGTMQITAFQHCNSHGTFKGQTLTLDSVQTNTGLKSKCSLSACLDSSQDASVCAYSVAEYWRIYEREFSQQVATDGNTNLKHKPSLTIHGNGTATVVVGGENVVDTSVTRHPMTPSPDPALVHWINAIWAVDQSGNVIASREFMPTDGTSATFTFTIPSGTTKIQAFEYCNKHGLFSGDQKDVTSSDVAGSDQSTCDAWSCPNNALSFATGTDCVALKAEATRRQTNDNGRSPDAFPLPFSTVSGNEKHSPYIVLTGRVAKAVVGIGAVTGAEADPIHPMVDDPDPSAIHYIEAIWVEDQNGEIIAFRQLSPSEPSPATLFFDIPEGTTSVQAYEYCNKHGLFQGEAVAVTADNTRSGARAGCSVQECIEGAGVSACQAFVSGELFRRETSGAAKDDSSGKHKPYLLVEGTTATIVVGIGATPGNEGGLIHPMTQSSDAEVVHWISHVYALDDLGQLVAMCELLPTDPAPATCTFEVPTGIVFLRPFEFCNKHGLYVGDVVMVQNNNMNVNASRQCRKRECSESQPSISDVSFSSASVEALYQSAQDSTERISTSNMCLDHSGVFSIAASSVTTDLQVLVDDLTLEGDAPSDVKRRVATFPKLFEQLTSLGGKWHGLPEVFTHAISTDGSSMRSELVNELQTTFSSRLLKAGSQTFVEGVDTAIEDKSQDLLIIEASFAMDWGYTNTKKLGPHYTLFYAPNFTAEFVDVALCAKTHGWMGMGWLTPSHLGHFMNYTDMVVTYVENDQAFVQDRFAKYIEEPLKDEMLSGQRQDDLGQWLNGENDLELNVGALGVTGKEWCPDKKCSPGFSIVQFRRSFRTRDAWDAQLPVRSSKIGVIFAFGSKDPLSSGLVQHIMSTTGYVDLEWNLDCPAGTFFEIFTIECKPCDKGYFRPATSPVFQCLQTPLGYYQDETGQADRKPCKPGFTTMVVGATDEFACMCPGPTLDAPDGTYHIDTCNGGPSRNEDGSLTRCAALGECKMCPEGMTCKGFRDLLSESSRRLTEEEDLTIEERIFQFCFSSALSLEDQAQCQQKLKDEYDEAFFRKTAREYCMIHLNDLACGHTTPELKQGFWSSPDDPLFVFRCRSKLECPGGVPGSVSVCASGREGVSCGVCKPNHYKGDKGVCLQCEAAEVWPFILMAIAGLLGVGAIVVYSRADLAKSTLTSLTATLVVGQLGVMVQTLAVFADLSMTWIEPIKAILSILSLINLDLDVIRIQCFMPTDDSSLSLLGQLLTFPIAALAVFIITFISNLAMKIKFSWDRYFNALGLAALVLYLSLCMASMRSLQCIRQPNGLDTVSSLPDVVCWQGGKHVELAVLSFIGIFIYAIGIIAYIIQIIWRYPSLATSGQGLLLLSQYRFLFQRFGTHSYFWGAYFLLQKLMVALVPMIFPNSAMVQIVCICCLLLVYMVSCVRIMPWATPIGNLADVVTQIGLVMFLLVSSFLVEVDLEASELLLGVLLTTLVSLVMIFLVSLVIYMLYKKFWPGYLFDVFLCHHKLGAAVLCRWLKHELFRVGKIKAFLDSDELEGLADIGDIVKSDTKTLVIVASKMVLTRPWCTVEVCSGVTNKIPIVLVQCPDFTLPVGEDLIQMESSWNENDLMIFASNGLDPQRVTECYSFLAGVPTMNLDQFGSDTELENTVRDICAACAGKFDPAEAMRTRTTKAFMQESTGATIIVLGAGKTAEARMTSKVLRNMVLSRVGVVVTCVFTPEEALREATTARYMLVVLTAGLLQDELFQETLVALDKARRDAPIEIVTALADQKFEFPSKENFEELGKKSAQLEVSSKRVINILALPFSAHGSINVMDTQANELCRRFKLKDKSSNSLFTVSTDDVEKDTRRVQEQPDFNETNVQKDMEDMEEPKKESAIHVLANPMSDDDDIDIVEGLI